MSTPDSMDTLSRQLYALLAGHPDHALFVSELAARLPAPAPSAEEFERALGALPEEHVVLIDHAAPDPHLLGDLRVIAVAVPPGTDPAPAAERVWNRWVREALAGHRCC